MRLTGAAWVAVLKTLRAVYVPWLENTSRHLQKLIRDNGRSVSKRSKQTQLWLPFRDDSSCLRMGCGPWMWPDNWAGETWPSVAGIESTRDWEWSTIPSATATAKPAASPLADAVQGGEAGDQFSTRSGFHGVNQILTQDRFIAALKSSGAGNSSARTNTGDPSGSAWTEWGRCPRQARPQRGLASGAQRWTRSSRFGQPNRRTSQSRLD